MAGLYGGKGDLRGVTTPPPEHYITYFPEHEGCEVCQDSKAQASPRPRRKETRLQKIAAGESPQPLDTDTHLVATASGDLLSADHAVNLDPNDYATDSHTTTQPLDNHNTPTAWQDHTNAVQCTVGQYEDGNGGPMNGGGEVAKW